MSPVTFINTRSKAISAVEKLSEDLVEDNVSPLNVVSSFC